MHPYILFMIVWVLWAVSWIAASLWSKRTQVQLAPRKTWTYRSLLTAGTVLLLVPRTRAIPGATRIWHVGFISAHVLLALTILGIAFAWWARIRLGPLWSGGVTRKEDHRIIDTGPYALVRHPIYTGLLLAVLASTIAKASPLALCGFAILATGLWIKARYEEEFLATELAPDAYATYRRRVPMLVPFVPSGARE